MSAPISNDLPYRNINNYVQERLKSYYIAAPLRALEAQDAAKAAKVIKQIFEQVLIRYNPKILEEYNDWGIPSQEAMLEFLDMLDDLCTFIVEKNFSREAIEDCLYTILRLP